MTALDSRSPLFSGSKALTASATFFTAFLIFLFSSAPDLTWQHFGTDGGDLISAAVTQGIPHPSGYPLYILAGRVFYLLPIDPVARRFTLLSAVSMAGAAGFLSLTCLNRKQNETRSSVITAVAVGLTFAFSSLVWSQAIITEVYGLSLLLLSAFLWSLLTERPFLLTGFLLGLSITSHLINWLMLPLALLLIPRRKWGLLLLGLLPGLLPLAALPWLASDTSPVVWGDPGTIEGWWWLVSGRLYRGYLFALPPAEWPARLLNWGPDLLGQFTWAGIPLIIAGIFLTEPRQRIATLGILGTAVFYLLLAFGYLPNDAIVNTLPAWLLLSLLLAPAYRRLSGWILILPLILVLINFNRLNLNEDYQVRLQAEAMLTAVPAQAILETPGDPTIFALWYFQYVENNRQDIVLIDESLYAFDWYRTRLGRLNPGLMGLDQINIRGFREMNEGKRPYCQATLNTDDNNLYSMNCIEKITHDN